ncbi:hypothetical protein LCGC14_0295660 [marine sediment metagenome]|uniref:Putative regulatory protein FmdB zinc ribbon domain-containing protein n=1 Tax=marine sediment metagenome TaxID=412755 RepID=A0A0F9WD12_9ZZZZ|nr:zinc ribbon domain-containing protein [Phycisphaerae bacterium]HDZ43024.1 zinc ribbon domain-containing protein [Phycisphaerae bacterium]
MPTYDYRCHECGHEFEKFQSIKAPSIRKCPECGKLKVKRLLGAGAGIIFKGSGFYQTDYRSDSYRKAAEKDKPAGDSKAAGDTDSKSEGKPADKKPSDKSGDKAEASSDND